MEQEKRVLRIVAKDFSKRGYVGDINPDSIIAAQKDNNSWWYLHGKLEEMVGFDKAVAINCKDAGVSQWTEYPIEISDKREQFAFGWQMKLDGMIAVKVEGIDEPCVGYFYTAPEYWKKSDGSYCKGWRQQGLVCLKSDKKACEYAYGKMVSKAITL